MRRKKEKLKKKKHVQSELRTRLGLTVDLPKSGGSGTSNDGNCARRFFRAHETVSEILGVDHILVKRCWITLSILARNLRG